MADCELGNLRQEICDLKTALATLVLNAAHPPAHLTYTVGAFAWDDDTQVGNIPIVTVPATPAPEVVVVADTSARTALAPQKLNQLLIQTTDAANGNFSVWSATGLVAGNWTLKTGTLGSQNANAVSITGGSITGITPLGTNFGGTGGTTPNEFRYAFNLNSAPVAGGAIDWAPIRIWRDFLTTDTVYGFINEVDGLDIKLAVNNGSGGHAVTFTSAIEWEGGTQPTPGGAATVDIYSFVMIGSVIYGSAKQGFPG